MGYNERPASECAALDELRDQIVDLCAPREIFLFSRKQSPAGELTAVKLCVIIPSGDARAVECRLYVSLESELPFDVLVYTEEEWRRLLAAELSFANRIRETGRVLYAAD